jgi:outer membrane protein assembly factor BamE (lipoprotein component of BamABCDE complex)
MTAFYESVPPMISRFDQMSSKKVTSRLALVALLFYTLLCVSCVQTTERHSGYKFSEHAAVGVGQTKHSVVQTLGSPTLISGFDKNVWYYVGIDSLSVASQNPKRINTRVLEVRFDPYYEVTTAVDMRESGWVTSNVPYVGEKNLEAYRLRSTLEKATSSLQPTPIK